MHLSTLEPKSKVGTIVGGMISGVLGLLLILVAVFCFLRQRRRAHSSSSLIPYTFVGDPEKTHQLPTIRTVTPLAWPVNRLKTSRTPTLHADTTDDGIGNASQLPAQDPEIITNQALAVPGAGHALERLQELTREVEEELRELGNRARSGQLSDNERERLDEIRRTTGLTIVYDPRRGRFSTTSSATSYTASPPSYRSDCD